MTLEMISLALVGEIKKIFKDSSNAQAIGLWISAVGAGLIAVGYATVFRMADSAFYKIVKIHPSVPYFLTPIAFLGAWYLVWRLAPAAAGSGIPQILAASELEESKESGSGPLLSIRTALVKVMSSLVCLLGGGAIGREGPTLQVSASLFYFFSQKTKRFTGQLNAQTWVVSGAAAGLASAFNTPLGGIVYAIEELSLNHFHKIRTAVLSAVIISGLVAQWLLGSYLYLGFPQLSPIGFSFMPEAILNGALTGLLGACFARLLYSLLQKRLQFKDVKHLALITLLCGLAVAGLTAFDIRSAGPGIEVMSKFLFSQDRADLQLVVVRLLSTTFSYLSGAAGGIFSPSLAIGGTIGSFLTNFFGAAHPHLMPLLGMIGFLTGVTRTPFTSFILVLEMTDRHNAVFPMMLAAVTAQWVAGFVDKHSFYENVKNNFLPSAMKETIAR